MPLDSGSTLEAMKSVRRWLVWKYGPKPKGKKAKKLPFYADGQPRRKPIDVESDWNQLASHDEAKVFCKYNPSFMLGFALGPDGTGNHWQGLDFDGTLGGANELPGYVEKSPSKNGYHSTGYGRQFYAYSEEFEAYSSGRFLTFTGDLINNGPLHDFSDFVSRRHGKLEEHVAASRSNDRSLGLNRSDNLLGLHNLSHLNFSYVSAAIGVHSSCPDPGEGRKENAHNIISFPA